MDNIITPKGFKINPEYDHKADHMNPLGKTSKY